MGRKGKTMSEEPQGNTTPSISPKKRRWGKSLLAVMLLLLLYNGCARTLVARHDAAQPRDPETGVLVGAEVRTLGPESAETALLFIHGFVGGSNNFWEVPDQLAAEGYRVQVMLLPGHGTYPRDFAITPKDDFTQAVRDEIHALQEKHPRVILVGHSMGGALSTIAASEESLDGIVLGAPYFGVTYHWYYLLPVETWSTITAPILRWVYKANAFICVDREDAKSQILSYRWIPAQGTSTLHSIGEHANADATLNKVTCPVLLLHSPGDFAASYQASENAFARLASTDKTFVTLPNSNHHIYWDNDRDQVADEIKRFVKRLDQK